MLALFNNYEDVLVLINYEAINVSVYDDESITTSAFIQMTRLFYQKFPTSYKVVISLVSSLD